MKVLTISSNGSLHGIAARLQHEGWSSMYRTTGPKLSDVPRSMDFRSDLRHVDLCILAGDMDRSVSNNVTNNARFVLGAGSNMSMIVPSANSFLAFFNGMHWVMPFFEIVSLDRMLSGDLGVESLNMAVALRPQAEFQPEWADDLKTVQEQLESEQYRGPIRFRRGQPPQARVDAAEMAAFAELLRAPLGETLYDIASARARELPVRQEQSVALQLSVPPWPQEGRSARSPLSIQINSGARKHFWPADMSVDHELAGFSGLLGHVSAYGRYSASRRPLREAGNRVFHVLDGISGDKLALQYRVDAVSALETLMKETYNGR